MKKQRIICFGDSNTFGAHGFSGGRYSMDERWTGILSSDPGLSGRYEFINMGENGLDIPSDEWDMNYYCMKMAADTPAALIIIMLGSNDLLMNIRTGMNGITARMERFVNFLLCWRDSSGADKHLIDGDPSRILLIAPTPTAIAGYGPECARFDKISLEFADAYHALSVRKRLNFGDAGSWNVYLGPDGVHFTKEGHRNFARGVKTVLSEILPQAAFS